MGVPAFFRWLAEKYPKVIHDVLERRRVRCDDGSTIPLDLTEPNPNNYEWDNLYVDMNGLIHPCSHPEDRDAPTTEIEMYINITKYLDRLFCAIRPRKILFLAIDGVAPRAKMNQQRSRRFRAAKDAKERKDMMKEVMHEMDELGIDTDESSGDAHAWDSNVITPGTEFMSRLSVYIWFYILDNMNRDPAWQNVKVFFSDASEPGEGEHKIMQFIRNQRAQDDYDPNVKHVLHGLDADLIMLALATHEPHFTILRELVTFGGKRDNRDVEKSDGQKMLDAQYNKEMLRASSVNPRDEWIYAKPLQALRISVLREYLQNEFKCLEKALSFQYDFERVIDDFVFLCFFVGNDFLPHLPSLDIRDGAIDFLLQCYTELLPSLGDYITSPGGNVNLRQADVILGKVGEVEDEVFKQRKINEDNAERRKIHNRNVNKMGGMAAIEAAAVRQHALSRENSIRPVATQTPQHPSHVLGVVPLSLEAMKAQLSETLRIARGGAVVAVTATTTTTEAPVKAEDNKVAAQKLRESLLGKRGSSSSHEGDGDGKGQSSKFIKIEVDIETSSVPSPPPDATATVTEDAEEEFDDEDDNDEDSPPAAPLSVPIKVVKQKSESEIAKAKEELKRRLKEKESRLLDQYKESLTDEIKLHEVGWKQRYYEDRYKKENIAAGGGLQRMCKTYIEGLCWVLKYYYEGCPSWNWYYPFHYAPFASDLVNIDSYEIKFELAEPFRPVEQLLAVLPADSVHALPEACHYLMTDPSSPIFDLYVDDVPVDPNGKHLPWLWILLLPFINEKRVTDAYKLCSDSLTYEEKVRNIPGKTVLVTHRRARCGESILQSMAYEASTDVCDELRSALLEESERSEGYEAAHSTTVDKKSSAEQSSVAVRTQISHISADGIAGQISPPLPHLFSSLDAPVKAPATPADYYRDIVRNQGICVTFEYLPDSQHQSRLLPGLRLPTPTLGTSDMIPRRPPRLNKGGFNLLDIANKNRNQQIRANNNQPLYSHVNFSYEEQERERGRYPHQQRYNQQQYNPYPQQQPQPQMQNPLVQQMQYQQLLLQQNAPSFSSPPRGIPVPYQQQQQQYSQQLQQQQYQQQQYHQHNQQQHQYQQQHHQQHHQQQHHQQHQYQQANSNQFQNHSRSQQQPNPRAQGYSFGHPQQSTAAPAASLQSMRAQLLSQGAAPAATSSGGASTTVRPLIVGRESDPRAKARPLGKPRDRK